MIGRIKGRLIEKKPPIAIVDVAGVGYEINASMNTFYQLPEVGSTVTFKTHFIVREDAQLLYGFITEKERKLFRILIKVNGVGPKLAITLLSSVEPDLFVSYVFARDSGMLTKLPGIGKKTAEKIILEVKDKLNNWHQDSSSSSGKAPTSVNIPTDSLSDALEALLSLGYKAVEANRALSGVDVTLEPEQIIKKALSKMAQPG